MSALLNLRLDFQSLPEFRLYLSALATAQSCSVSDAEPVGIFAFMKLWVSLGYEAQRPTEAGALTEVGVLSVDATKLWSMEVGHPFATSTLPALEAGGVLEKRPDGSYFCARFAQVNAHLSVSHESKEDKGARRSAIVRSRNLIAAEADQQAMLLPPEIYKDRAGRTLTDVEVRRTLIHIRMLDRCLGTKTRHQGSYTEGLIADAVASLEDVPADGKRREEFYYWVNDNATHPALPKTTEQLLADWQRVMEMKRSMERRSAEVHA